MSEQSQPASPAAEVSVAEFKRAVGSFATGVTVVTVCDRRGRFHGFTANSFASVSLDPPMVLVCLHRQSPSLDGFAIGGAFAVNILGADQLDISGHFARHHDDKFAGIRHRPGRTGAPVLIGCHAVVECRLEHWYHGGDHVILLAHAEAAVTSECEPLVFHRSRYASISPPETA